MSSPSAAPRPAVDVLIVSPTRFYREGLASALTGRPGIGAVRTAAHPAGALAALRAGGLDLVLVDNTLPDGPGLARTIAARDGGARVVVLAAEWAPEDLLAWAEAGIAGYVSRDESLGGLVGVVHDVARGEFACSHAVVHSTVRRIRAFTRLLARTPDTPLEQLTEREDDILGLISRGHSNKHIAQRLGITMPTVKTHVHSILAKLHVRRRGEAAALYLGAAAPPSHPLPLPERETREI